MDSYSTSDKCMTNKKESYEMEEEKQDEHNQSQIQASNKDRMTFKVNDCLIQLYFHTNLILLLPIYHIKLHYQSCWVDKYWICIVICRTSESKSRVLYFHSLICDLQIWDIYYNLFSFISHMCIQMICLCYDLLYY